MPDPTQLTLWSQNDVFEKIKHLDGNTEYWLARELMVELEYTDWRNFKKVIGKAKTACKNSENDASRHFVGVSKMVDLGDSIQREIEDFKLSRFACYLIAQNGDPKKRVIAEAQLYFAAQTRRQELAQLEQQKRSELKRKQDIVEYQSKGHRPDWSETRIDTKESHKQITGALQDTHEDHKPDYGKVFGAQNEALFNLAKREIADHLGLLPAQESKLRDHLGKYALQAIDIANRVAAREMNKQGRQLSTEEHVDIVTRVAREVAEPIKKLANIEQVDYLSGAPLDEQGRALINRQQKLLKGGKS